MLHTDVLPQFDGTLSSEQVCRGGLPTHRTAVESSMLPSICMAKALAPPNANNAVVCVCLDASGSLPVSLSLRRPPSPDRSLWACVSLTPLSVRVQAESLLSYLTVAYVRLPLVAHFFADLQLIEGKMRCGNRVTFLFNEQLQSLFQVRFCTRQTVSAKLSAPESDAKRYCETSRGLPPACRALSAACCHGGYAWHAMPCRYRGVACDVPKATLLEQGAWVPPRIAAAAMIERVPFRRTKVLLLVF